MKGKVQTSDSYSTEALHREEPFCTGLTSPGGVWRCVKIAEIFSDLNPLWIWHGRNWWRINSSADCLLYWRLSSLYCQTQSAQGKLSHCSCSLPRGSDSFAPSIYYKGKEMGKCQNPDANLCFAALFLRVRMKSRCLRSGPIYGIERHASGNYFPTFSSHKSLICQIYKSLKSKFTLQNVCTKHQISVLFVTMLYFSYRNMWRLIFGIKYFKVKL